MWGHCQRSRDVLTGPTADEIAAAISAAISNEAPQLHIPTALDEPAIATAWAAFIGALPDPLAEPPRLPPLPAAAGTPTSAAPGGAPGPEVVGKHSEPKNHPQDPVPTCAAPASSPVPEEKSLEGEYSEPPVCEMPTEEAGTGAEAGPIAQPPWQPPFWDAVVCRGRAPARTQGGSYLGCEPGKLALLGRAAAAVWERARPPGRGQFRGGAPLVTVVITHFNRAKLLRSAVLSVAQQDYPQRRLELVVVDDGSPDPDVSPSAV